MLDEHGLRCRRAALHAIDHDDIGAGVHGELHVAVTTARLVEPVSSRDLCCRQSLSSHKTVRVERLVVNCMCRSIVWVAPAAPKRS